MTAQTKKAGRKSNAEKAALAAQAQELAKIEIVDGEKVVTDLEPVAKAPVTLSVDADGEDLGDVSNTTPKTPVIEAGELVETFSTEVQGTRGTEVTELPKHKATFTIEGGVLPEVPGIEKAAARLAAEIDAEMIAHVNAIVAAQDDFKPILVPTMVGDAQTGHIPCPKAVWELVQIEGWQDLIDDQPAHIKAGLKSVLHWQKINGTAKVRCQSSSRFAEAK
jgi:hypothetical protein